MSEEEYGEITPIQFAKLMKRRNKDMEQHRYNAALICSVIANVNRNPKKRGNPFHPKDFMPQPKKQQTRDEMFAHVKALNKALGGTGGD